MGATLEDIQHRLEGVGLKQGRDFAEIEFRDGSSTNVEEPDFHPAGNFVTLKGVNLETPADKILYRQPDEYPRRSRNQIIENDPAFQRATDALRLGFSEWGGGGHNTSLPVNMTITGVAPVEECAPVQRSKSSLQNLVDGVRSVFRI